MITIPQAPLLVPPALETARLHLKVPELTDIEGFWNFGRDADATKFIGGVWPDKTGWRQLQATLGHWVLKGFGFYSVFEKSTDQWIGRIGFVYPDTSPGLELAWGLLSRHWGQGYATEAARALSPLRPLSERLISSIDPQNYASQRVAQKLGCVPKDSFMLFDAFPCTLWEHPPA